MRSGRAGGQMNIDTIKKIKKRIWFWKENERWSSNSSSVEPSKRYKEIQERVNNMIFHHNIKFYRPLAYIYLVDKPYTFGHSQLVMEFNDEDDPHEADRFTLAASIIQNSLPVFKDKLSQELNNFSDLAKHTGTRGNYIKTLILRASANENIYTTYKIHLVPYFKSNEEECQRLYYITHGTDHNGKGGLVGWLGVKETKVDNCGPIDINKLRLPELAQELARAKFTAA
jgi:hypothetical protein